MGTKRPFDENVQEFLKHPKHIENGNKPDSFVEEEQFPAPSHNVVIVGEGVEKVIVVPDMVEKVFEIGAPLPLATCIAGQEMLLGPDCSSRKEIPFGPEHQANVSEFDSNSARNYVSHNGREEVLAGVCVISNQGDQTLIAQADCKCMDNGSIRCVQQHVNEARLNLKESLGFEKFISLGFNNMGEEVACNWAEEQHFQDIIYSNPFSHGKKFWEVLSFEFPTRTKKELVSYYFNVFIYRRRAIQNRSQLLAIDSDDDEWWGTKRGSSGVTAENDDLVVGGPVVDHGDHDHDSLSEDGDIVSGDKENHLVNGSLSSNLRNDEVTSQSEQEKPVGANNVRLSSDSYLHWDLPYSTMGSANGVDLLPTSNIFEEIFGSSGKSA